MSNVEVYNDKIIRNFKDGWGYRITEGDIGEIVIHYFEERKEGQFSEEKLRVYAGEMAECLGAALIEKSREMEADFPKAGSEKDSSANNPGTDSVTSRK